MNPNRKERREKKQHEGRRERSGENLYINPEENRGKPKRPVQEPAEGRSERDRSERK